MAFCTNCGARLEEDACFCGICGQSVVREDYEVPEDVKIPEIYEAREKEKTLEADEIQQHETIIKEAEVKEEKVVLPEICEPSLKEKNSKLPLISILLATVGMALHASDFWYYFLDLSNDVGEYFLWSLMWLAGYVFIVLGFCQQDKKQSLFLGIGMFGLAGIATIHEIYYLIDGYEFSFIRFLGLLFAGIYVLCGIGFLQRAEKGSLLLKIGAFSLMGNASFSILISAIDYEFEYLKYYADLMSLLPILLGVAVLLYLRKQKA